MAQRPMPPPDSIPLSMLNALAFCERRFVYEFVFGEMIVNHHVREGELRHGPRAHQPGREEGGRIQRSVTLHSTRWRVHGIVDFLEERDGALVPVEYKKGRQGPWESDAVQLCAAALCLEEWLDKEIAFGEVFYFGSRRRRDVPFDPALRQRTAQIIERAFALSEKATLPPPVEPWSKCKHCSLEPLCLPRETRLLMTLDT